MLLSYIALSIFLLIAVNFQWRIHKGHGQGLAFGPLLLLAVRREPDGTTLRDPG